ncbi:uncharacterized protein [Haliotis cracherodii]|uniref:uncharacterized protein n=1 Tax=Haliotis cracherodii TaxID=6455 RepID=UPI0039E93912
MPSQIDISPTGRVRPGKASVAGSGAILLIIYCVGLGYDTWMVAYEKKHYVRGRVIAKAGIFSACGYDFNLQVDHEASPNDCFSLLLAGVPGWVRAVQFFAILCLTLLCFASIMWGCIVFLGKLDEMRYMGPFLVLWTTTGLLSIIHPIIFAYNMRPGDLVMEDRGLKPQYRFTFFWGAFYLHCVAAGFINLITLMALCCLCLIKYL